MKRLDLAAECTGPEPVVSVFVPWTVEEEKTLWALYLKGKKGKSEAAREAIDEAMRGPLKGRTPGSVKRKLGRLLKKGGVVTVDRHVKGAKWSDGEQSVLMALYVKWGSQAKAAKKYVSRYPERTLIACQSRLSKSLKSRSYHRRDSDWHVVDVGRHNIELADRIFGEMEDLSCQE